MCHHTKFQTGQDRYCTGNGVASTRILAGAAIRGLRVPKRLKIVRRSLPFADMHVVREPPGLDHNDGKRPDGLTIFSSKDGKLLVWDVTCVDTLVLFHKASMSSTAEKAAERLKVYEYWTLPTDYFFSPVGFQTFDSCGPVAKTLLIAIGERVKSIRENCYLLSASS